MQIPQQLRKPLLFIPAVIVIAAIFAFFIIWLFDKREAYAFEQIKLDARESLVITAMGAPDRTTACGEKLWWGDDHDYRGRNDGRCVQEDHYENLLNAWAVGYSADRHVVSKHHLPKKN